jgi:hypothetical protein
MTQVHVESKMLISDKTELSSYGYSRLADRHGSELLNCHGVRPLRGVLDKLYQSGRRRKNRLGA